MTICKLREALEIAGNRLYGRDWTGNEPDARDLPDAQVVGGWMRMDPESEQPIVSEKGLGGLRNALNQVKRPRSSDPQHEAGGRMRYARHKLENLFQQGHVATHLHTSQGRNLPIHPGDWTQFKVNYSSSIGVLRQDEGFVWVDREQLERRIGELEPVSEPDPDAPAKDAPTQRGRRPIQLESAGEALRACYPGGIPALPHKEILGTVNDYLEQSGKLKVSHDTMSRAMKQYRHKPQK